MRAEMEFFDRQANADYTYLKVALQACGRNNAQLLLIWHVGQAAYLPLSAKARITKKI